MPPLNLGWLILRFGIGGQNGFVCEQTTHDSPCIRTFRRARLEPRLRLGISRAWMHWLENDARLARVADEFGYFKPLRFSRDEVCDGFRLDLHDELHAR